MGVVKDACIALQGGEKKIQRGVKGLQKKNNKAPWGASTSLGTRLALEGPVVLLVFAEDHLHCPQELLDFRHGLQGVSGVLITLMKSNGKIEERKKETPLKTTDSQKSIEKNDLLAYHKLLDVSGAGEMLLEIDDPLLGIHEVLASGIQEHQILEVNTREGDHRGVSGVDTLTHLLVVELAAHGLEQLIGHLPDPAVHILFIREMKGKRGYESVTTTNMGETKEPKAVR